MCAQIQNNCLDVSTQKADIVKELTMLSTNEMKKKKKEFGWNKHKK